MERRGEEGKEGNGREGKGMNMGEMQQEVSVAAWVSRQY